jgi:protein-tyrosine-phosphatase
MKKNILFVCTGNSCRSVMAEGLFKKLVEGQEDQFQVGSAGVAAPDGYPASSETVKVMQEHGVDVSAHLSRHLTSAMVRVADKIFVMEQMHKESVLRQWPEAGEKVHLLTEYAADAKQRSMEIDIPDPIRMPDNFYKNVFRVIRDCVKRIAEDMGVPKQKERS